MKIRLVTPPSQTEAVTNPTVNSSLAASDSTTEGNTGSSQAEMQTKAATVIASQASTAPNASSVSSSSTSLAQTSSTPELQKPQVFLLIHQKQMSQLLQAYRRAEQS